MIALAVIMGHNTQTQWRLSLWHGPCSVVVFSTHMRKAGMSLTSPSPIDTANEQALQRIYAARPYLVAIRPARELLPQLREYTILHAGPPALWKAMCGPMC